MKRFESGDVFKPAYQGQGFEPLQVADTTPLLRQNNQARLQEAKMFADQRMTDLKLEEQSLKYQALLENEEVERLAEFSDTLSETMIAGAKLRNEQVEQYYLMQAYTDGVNPQETQALEEQEAALKDGATLVNDEAGKLESGGISVDAIKKLRSLSGWAKYGYMRGLLEQAGSGYGNYFTQASTQMEVTVGDETFTLANAQTGPQRAAAKAAIADSYLSQFRGANPALLNKYLFPAMKKWEQSEDLDFAERQRKAYEADKIEELKDELYSAVNSDTPGFEVESLIDRHKGTFGTRGQAVTKTLEQLKAMARNGTLTRDQWEVLQQEMFTNTATGKPVPFGELFEGRIKRLEFEKAFANAEQDVRELDKLDEQQQLAELEKQFEEDVKLNGGYGNVPEKLLLEYQIRKEQITGDSTEWEVTKNFKSALDVDVETQLANIKSTLNQRGATPYLTESEYAKLLPETKAKLPANLKIMSDSSGLSPTSDNFQEVSKRANELAKNHYVLTGDMPHTTASYYFAENAKKHYQAIYLQEFNEHGNAELAHKNAMLDMNKTAATKKEDNPFIPPPIKEMARIEPPRIVKDANTAIANGVNWRTDKLTALGSSPFRNAEGHKTSIEKLTDWAANGGKGPLPSEFQALASTMRGVSAWDIAERQYYLHTGNKLSVPGAEREVRKLHPDSKILLYGRVSPSRTNRAALQSSGGINEFADLVGFHESSAHGGYDAMNTGGYGIGYGNRAIGSANSKDVFDRPISEMTVGELIELGKQKKIFAAGRYQFIPETLRWVVAREGIPLDAKFDKNTQDYLFAAQVRWRLDYHSKHGGLVNGFRTEWQGLWYARESQILDGLDAFKASPFNDPQYLHPALVKGGN